MAANNRAKLVGQKFNMITVISFSHTQGLAQDAIWDCVCECGKELKVSTARLRGNIKKSCGCISQEKFTDLSGKVFGKLTVIKWVRKGIDKWECLCLCGKTNFVTKWHLESGVVKSCGCMISKANVDRLTKHNMSRSIEYNVYKIMKQRCYNRKLICYKDYGGRGIFVCDRWLNSFENFFEDMGFRPDITYSLERINNDLGYFKENCYWATRTQQSRNKRSNVWIDFNGKRMILKDWANELNLKGSSTITRRLKEGQSFEFIYNKFKKNDR